LLKYVLGAIAVVFAWAVVLLLRLPEWIAIVTTAIVVGALLLVYLVRRLRARRAARELENAIAAQGDAYAKLVRPEQEAEIRALQGEFVKAVGALKASRLGKGGVNALYALPWYVIIGPPGAGKSTALRNSGLQFPYLSQKGGAVRGIGGTRNCDWWLTNEAILLDTAGRYTSEDNDRDEWLSFLDLLRGSRSRKPIDGIAVAVSVAELAGARDEEVSSLAQRIRERVDEVMQRLQMVVPVYVLFTKCDLIEGFVETFADLKKQERGQILGFTLPTGGDATPGEVFTEHFQELYESIGQRALKRLGEERRIEARELIYEFPEQFLLLHDNLQSFVDTLFERNVYKETPVLRGVYFTSGTQEGRPIDRVMAQMAQAFGVAPRLPSREPVVEQKSYFLRDVFAQVMFPDQGIAARSRDELKRQERRAWAIGATVFACSLLVSSLPAWSFVQNRRLIASTEAVVAEVSAHREAAGAGAPIPLAKLEPLSRRVDELRSYELGRPPPELRFGMYSGGALYPKVKDLYAEVLRTDLLGPLERRDVEAMREFVQRGGRAGGAEHARFYELLKTYLCLTGPRASDEPPLEGDLGKWLADRIVKAWTAQLGAPPSDDELAQMARHARLFVELLASEPKLAFPRDEKLTHELRLALAGASVENVVLEPLIADVSADGYDLALKDILGSVTGPLETRAIVRGAFTRRAWEERVRGRLGGSIGEPWVLGPEGGRLGKPSDQAKAIRARYFAMYIQEWQDFLRSLRVKETSSPIDALSVLQDLTRGVPPPYGRLMREVANNVHLEEEAAGKLKGLAENTVRNAAGDAGKRVKSALGLGQAKDLGPADVEAAFADFVAFGVPPTPQPAKEGAPPPKPQQVALDVYQEQLEFIRDALAGYIENPESTPQLVARLQAARTRVRSLVETQPIGWRPLFQALLWPPIEGASISTEKSVASGKGIQWCNEVVVPYDRNLKSKYPFNPNGVDAPLADVADFYKPDGVLWKFYQASLASEVQQVGDRFELSTKLGGNAGFSGELLGFLARSHEISTVLFPPGAKDPLVEFEVRIRPAPGVASIVFDLDGQSVKTQNEPERWFRLRWPGEGKAHGAAIRVRGAQNLSETIQQDGEWGWFRLLEQGAVSASLSSRVFSVTWTLSSRKNVQITFDIRPLRSESPFFGLSRRSGLKLMQAFRGGEVSPPHAITRGGGCRVTP